MFTKIVSGGGSKTKLFSHDPDGTGLHSGDGTTYKTFSDTESIISNYATGANTKKLTFTKSCTLCIFIGTGRQYGSGVSKISIIKNNTTIEELSQPVANVYNSTMVNLEMESGDTLEISVQGTSGGYASHMWGISVLE